jgi:hypothetical protein
MATPTTIRDGAQKVALDSGEQWMHCSSGWVYEVDPDTGEDIAMGRWMYPEVKAIDKAGAR